MNDTLARLSVSTRIGSDTLARRVEEVVAEFERTLNANAAYGQLAVIASQAVKELHAAEQRPQDPAEVLQEEDDRLTERDRLDDATGQGRR